MNFAFRLKYRFFNAFREIFVHHHGSLEFRSKVFALIIAANDKPPVDCFIMVKEMGMEIYNDDEDRVNLLMLTTKEIVQKIHDKNHDFNIDQLVYKIQQDLEIVPRYAQKIDIKSLKSLVVLTYNEDTIAYQERILEFLSNLQQQYNPKKR
ncbi:MAG: hypothetical protein FAF05_03485 [Epsilonproteobacteria bacterium]|nr:hypothetical protein [Campylobacterota bacterium]